MELVDPEAELFGELLGVFALFEFVVALVVDPVSVELGWLL